jgi:hypothetical protein
VRVKRLLLDPRLLAFAIVACAAWLAFLEYGPRDVRVNVRWRADVTDTIREDLEARLRLTRSEYVEGTTWTYWLDRPTRDDIRTLILHEAVEDTEHLHRTQFRPEIAQYYQLWFGLYAVLGGLGGSGLTWLFQFLWSSSAGRIRLVPAQPARPRLWTTVALVAVAPVVLALVGTLWRTPYPISETVGILEDTLRTSSPFDHFDPSQRSWFRPLYFLTWDLFLRGGDSLEGALLAFRVLEVAPILLLVGLFILALRPSSLMETGAALCATAVLVGAPAFRENLELPLLYTLVAMPMVVVVWQLLEVPSRAWHGVVFIVLAAIAIGFKEQGLLLVPLVVLGPLIRAPGASRVGAVALAMLTVAYMAMRITTGGVLNVFEGDISIGFTDWSAAEANLRFQDSFLWVYAYNALSVISNLLLSEPSRGHFGVIERVVQGSFVPSGLIAVSTSFALSGLIGWWALVTVRRDWRRGWTPATRLVVLLAITIIASGVLAFSYPRDRHGAMPLVLYAAAAYYALCMVLERARHVLSLRRVFVAAAVGLLALGWQLRMMGTVYDAEERSQRNQTTWLAQPSVVRANFKDRPVYLQTMEALRAQGLAVDISRPRRYPQWLRLLLTQ